MDLAAFLRFSLTQFSFLLPIRKGEQELLFFPMLALILYFFIQTKGG